MGDTPFVPLSSLVILPKPMTDGALRPLIETLAEIDALHHVTNRGVVRVKLDSRRTPMAEYSISVRKPGLSANIRMCKSASEPRFTFAHELAHFMDNRLLHPLGDTFASHYDDSFASLVQAWSISPNLLRVRNILANKRLAPSRADRNFLNYLIRPEELFARSYAQFLATRSSSDMLRAELHRRQARQEMIGGMFISLQWDSKSFEPIMDALDNMLHAKGWL